MRDGFDRLSQEVAEAEAVGHVPSDVTPADDLSAMEQVLWCPNRGQLAVIALEECERRRLEGDPECTNPKNQIDGWPFCMAGNWKKRVFWVEPPTEWVTLYVRFEDKE